MKQEESGCSEKIKTAKALCEEYAVGVSEVEKRERCGEIRRELRELSGSLRGKISIDFPGLLLVLLDAYEITRDEGMLQEVMDGRNGFAVENDAEAMGAKNRYVLEDAECYAEMSRAARQTYSEKFTVGQMVEGYGRIYQDIIKKRSLRS